MVELQSFHQRKTLIIREPLGRGSAITKMDAEVPNRWKRIENLFRLASLVAISASAVLASVRFYNGRVDARKERSIALMSAWQIADEKSAYARLRAQIEMAIEEAGPIPPNIP